jgi:hypothetical protein
MRDFALVDWNDHDKKANPKASDRTSAIEPVDVLSSRLNYGTNDEYQTAEKNSEASAQVVSYKSSKSLLHSSISWTASKT